MEVEETVEEAGMVLQYRAWLGRRLAGEVGHAGHVLIEPLARWLLVRFFAKKKFWTSFLALSFQAPQFANFEPFFQQIKVLKWLSRFCFVFREKFIRTRKYFPTSLN